MTTEEVTQKLCERGLQAIYEVLQEGCQKCVQQGCTGIMPMVALAAVSPERMRTSLAADMQLDVNILALIDADFNTRAGKHAAMFKIGQTAAARQDVVFAAGLVCEAWSATLSAEEHRSTIISPSDHPDRREIAIVSVTSWLGGSRHGMREFTRDADDQIRWSGDWRETTEGDSTLLAKLFRGYEEGLQSMLDGKDVLSGSAWVPFSGGSDR